MTREENQKVIDAVERLNALKQFIGYDKDSEIVQVTQKSLDMAIKALEQKPSNDMVSRGLFEQIKWERDVAIEQLKELGYGLGEKPKMGYWIEGDMTRWKCSNCGYGVLDWNNTPYCPNCGAMMVDSQESEDKE